MAIIHQRQLFSWKEIENLADLERFSLLLKHLPDEQLMQSLESERGKGRNDYPIRAMWNSILAGIVYQHTSIESLRRELMRNAQLRQLCGFDLLKGTDAVPSSNAYTNLLKRLVAHMDIIDSVFCELVDRLSELLEGFGQTLAIDSKAINSRARRVSGAHSVDLRGELDADKGFKTYRGTRSDGSTWETVKSWFGFKLHLIVDAEYELPVAYSVTKASACDLTVGKEMIADLALERPSVLENAQFLLGDKAYDDTQLITNLWDEHNIKPVIDIRDLWRIDGARLVHGQTNVSHDYKGTVYCHCPVEWVKRPMAFGGFEKDRATLKYRCGAKHYGLECAGRERCHISDNIRIDIESNRRIFTPLARSSYKWKTTYKKRSAVERVNSRMDESFGFEKHFIRGINKMKVRCGLALIVMLGMAYGRLRQKQYERIRSLVTSAA
jgi:transposase